MKLKKLVAKAEKVGISIRTDVCLIDNPFIPFALYQGNEIIARCQTKSQVNKYLR